MNSGFVSPSLPRLVEEREPARAFGADARQLAWQREMERALSEAWFKKRDRDADPMAAAAGTGIAAAGQARSQPGVSHGDAGRVSVGHGTEPDAGASRRPVSNRDDGRPEASGRSAGLSRHPEADASASTDQGGSTPAAVPSARSAAAAAAAGTGEALAAAGTVAAGDVETARETGQLPAPPRLEHTESTGAAWASERLPIPVAAGSASLPLAAPVRAAIDGLLREAAPLARHSASTVERLATAVGRALEPGPPVRLHVELGADGATVWIGLDAAAAPELPALVASLSRWISRIGMRLGSVVCNGVVCLDASGTAERRDATSSLPARARAGDPHPATNVAIVIEKES